ncbi:hypothetical protein MTR67_034279 [Solanum verrucosum]|uniref:Uncharacterized protein n=1 Tax=Solanum verrucosum TaxID=315347 RepID=A0AAF0ZL59_SOLVR|nr:hypothetical protein MTR67_034279 [Solanum verrucosum]
MRHHRARLPENADDRRNMGAPRHIFGHRQGTSRQKEFYLGSWMGRMFGMTDLQLRVGGRPVSENEMATLAERYPLTDIAMYLCRMGPAFQEPIDDDDDATVAEVDDSNEDASYDIGPGDGDIDAGR